MGCIGSTRKSRPMEENKEYFVKIYHLAVAAGVVVNKSDFADKLGMSRSTISMAFKGDPRYLTDGLMRRVKAFALDKGLDEPEVNTKPEDELRGGVWLPEETRQIFENMSQTIRIQAELIAHYTGAVTLDQQYMRAVTPKNDLRR